MGTSIANLRDDLKKHQAQAEAAAKEVSRLNNHCGILQECTMYISNLADKYTFESNIRVY